jgi:hypothetical protein
MEQPNFKKVSNEQDMQSAISEMRAGIGRVDAFTQLLADERTKNEEKAKQESWTKYAALSMALIALIAGYSMSKGSVCAGQAANDLSEATYNQTKASDQWSFFQSKAQKALVTELEISLKSAQPNPDKEAIDALKAKVKRYEKEREEIKATAEKYEKSRDDFRKDAETMTALSNKFGAASQGFQIALAIGGLCLLSKKKPMFAITLLGAAYGIVKLAIALFC